MHYYSYQLPDFASNPFKSTSSLVAIMTVSCSALACYCVYVVLGLLCDPSYVFGRLLDSFDPVDSFNFTAIECIIDSDSSFLCKKFDVKYPPALEKHFIWRF